MAIFFIFVALISYALATALPQGLEAQDGNAVTSKEARELGMKWTGSIFPGAEPTVLYGDVNEIYDQILAINPSYLSDDVSANSSTEDPALERRQRFYPPDADRNRFACRAMASGSPVNIESIYNRLYNLKGNCETPGGSCRRMGCEETSGAYLCSESKNAVSIPCRLAAEYVNQIYVSCCRGSALWTASTGQSYSTRGFSVWAGYANCKHSSSSRPTQYPYPGGSLNGKCD